MPNLEAAEFIRGSLAPDLPHLRFLLVGPNPPPGISSPNVITTGHAPDLLPVLRDAAICIAPLANGSGTRLKILTYLAAARPVVATAKAVEGLPVRDEEHLLIRDTPQEFRSALRELVSDPARRRELASAGRKLVESKFDWRVHVDSLRAIANEAVAETPIGRLPAA